MQVNTFIDTVLDALAELAGRATAPREGQSMVEYAILGALIAVAAIAAVTTLGTAISAKFQDIATALG